MPCTHDEEGLTPKRRAFIDEYLIDFNATQAARRAGYSEHSAHTLGSRLLQVPAVKAALDKAIAARGARTRVTADRVIQEYARLAFANMRCFAEWDATGMRLRPHNDVSADDAAAVQELRASGEPSRVRIRLYDKRSSLDALARHVGVAGAGRRGTPGAGGWTGLPLPANERQRRARYALKESVEKLLAEKEKQTAETTD